MINSQFAIEPRTLRTAFPTAHMDVLRLAAPALALLLVSTAGGCRWSEWFRRNQAEPPPILFNALPTREEAVAAINANSARIQSLQTQGATVSVPGAPSIGAEIALEKHRNFRF